MAFVKWRNSLIILILRFTDVQYIATMLNMGKHLFYFFYQLMFINFFCVLHLPLSSSSKTLFNSKKNKALIEII